MSCISRASHPIPVHARARRGEIEDARIALGDSLSRWAGEGWGEGSVEMHLTLLSRAYCHLCDEMEAALRPLIAATPLAVLDVDAPEHAPLDARYGDAVPVLFAGDPADGRELCRHRLDAAQVLAALAESPEIR